MEFIASAMWVANGDLVAAPPPIPAGWHQITHLTVANLQDKFHRASKHRPQRIARAIPDRDLHHTLALPASDWFGGKGRLTIIVSAAAGVASASSALHPPAAPPGARKRHASLSSAATTWGQRAGLAPPIRSIPPADLAPSGGDDDRPQGVS
ncbi:N-succinylarginine dihydrolase [Klebsiella pneumoniae subsp. pneumoniae]|nr:N-succinylarginine dihydrolase [Klebsiella pneumoniae subsp. pneumoniae]